MKREALAQREAPCITRTALCHVCVRACLQCQEVGTRLQLGVDLLIFFSIWQQRRLRHSVRTHSAAQCNKVIKINRR